MLPPEIVGRYRRYKRGQRKLVCWLVETASRCGRLEEITTLPTSLGSSRLRQKGKKGKKRREKTGLAESGELEVRSHELLGLAEAVANAEPPVLIPEHILTTAEEVISGREECHDWYSSGQALEKGSDVEGQNETHRHFIEVLQKVRKLLIQAHSRTPSADLPTTSKASKTPLRTHDAEAPGNINDGYLNTLFEWLSVDDPNEETALGDDASALSIATASGAARVKVSFKQEDEDGVFQTFCFLQDLNDVRRFIVQTWQGYARGELSFVNASVVTDTAFGLLRRTDEDFAAANSIGSTDWQRLLEDLGITYFVRDGDAVVYPDPDRATDIPPQADSAVNIAELLCPIAFHCLDHYRTASENFCETEQRAMEDPGMQGFCDFPDAPVLHDMTLWLWEMVTETHMEAHIELNRKLIFDEFVQGLCEIHRKRDIRVWMVVASQTYMDVHDLLGEHAADGIELMRNVSSYHHTLRDDMDAYRTESLFGLDDVSGGVQHLRIGVEASDKMNSRVKLPRHPLRPEPLPATRNESCLATESYREALFPASAGLFLFDDKLNNFKDACEITPHGGFVILVAHLYRALHAMGPLRDTIWPDLEFVLDSFGQSRPLVAPKDREYDAAQACRHLAIDFGLRAEAFAKDFRSRPQRRAFDKGLRNLSLASPFLQAFHDVGLLNTLRYNMPYARLNGVEAMLRTLLDGEAEPPGKNSSKPRSAGARTQTRFTPVALLELMRAKLRDEEPLLNFDFIRFTLACARLMQALAARANGGAPPRLAGVQATYTELTFDLISSPPSSGKVAQAAAALKAHIRREGSVFLEQARGRSSGTLSADVKPRMDV